MDIVENEDCFGRCGTYASQRKNIRMIDFSIFLIWYAYLPFVLFPLLSFPLLNPSINRPILIFSS